MLFDTFSKLEPYNPPLEEAKIAFSETFNLVELLQAQEAIDEAMLHKLRKQDNTYVHLIDADARERYLMHKDNWPYYAQRMRFWSSYL